jgi:hypothetical protein
MKFGVAMDANGVEILYLFQVLRMRIELPDVRAAIATQDQSDRPALILTDSNGVGRGIYQDLREEMDHLLGHSKSFEGSTSPARKQQNFVNALPNLYDGLIRIPEQMTGLAGFFVEHRFWENPAIKRGLHDLTRFAGQLVAKVVSGLTSPVSAPI